jgi:hypothetical protein
MDGKEMGCEDKHASRWFIVRLIFDPEDGSDTFLKNVGSYADYTTQHPRRWHSYRCENLKLYKTFFLANSAQTGSRAHLASYLGLLPRV